MEINDVLTLLSGQFHQVGAGPIFFRHVWVNQWSHFFLQEVRILPDIDRGTSGGDFERYAEPTTHVFPTFSLLLMLFPVQTLLLMLLITKMHNY